MTRKQVFCRDFGGPYELRATHSAKDVVTFAIYRRDLDAPIASWKLPASRLKTFPTAVRDIARELEVTTKTHKPALNAGQSPDKPTEDHHGDNP